MNGSGPVSATWKGRIRPIAEFIRLFLLLVVLVLIGWFALVGAVTVALFFLGQLP